MRRMLKQNINIWKFIECFVCAMPCNPHNNPIYLVLLPSPHFIDEKTKVWWSEAVCAKSQRSRAVVLGFNPGMGCRRLASLMTKTAILTSWSFRDGSWAGQRCWHNVPSAGDVSVTHCSLRNLGKVMSPGSIMQTLRGSWWPWFPKAGLRAPSSNFPGTSG